MREASKRDDSVRLLESSKDAATKEKVGQKAVVGGAKDSQDTDRVA